MAARSLVQALEGIKFPCDRSRLIEYARRQEASLRSLEALEALPDREFHDMTELFSALPSKHDLARRRPTLVRMEPRPQPRDEKPEPQKPEQQKTGEFVEEAVPPPLAAPLQDECLEKAFEPQMDLVNEWWRLSTQMSQEWLRMVQRMWFPWGR